MSDPRFARLRTDPRFRRSKKKETRIVVDERFKDFLGQHERKERKGRVDKYGRFISAEKDHDSLKRFYRLEDGDAEGDHDATKPLPDFARGEILLESSDEGDGEEGTEKEESDEKSESDIDSAKIIKIGWDSSWPIDVTQNDEGAEIDLDEEKFADLDALAAQYARDNAEQSEEGGPRTHRLAIVNLDWDHVRASHLYKICASLVSPTAPLASTSMAGKNKKQGNRAETGAANVVRGRVLNVRVLPSQFGKERMDKEEIEGPPPEIFKVKRDLRPEEVNAITVYEVGGEEDYDKDALRKYQLERLRYYYAIVTCDTVDAASHIYNELEGTELERSANVFDMSFVPDDMNFNESPRDEALEDVTTHYKSVEFVTDALRHSNVKLTWDDDDPERIQLTRRTLTRKEIEEGDFRAYLASSSSDEGDEQPRSHRKDSKNTSRDKLRSLLLGGNENALPEGWGDEVDGDVDMEVTFTPGLTEKKDEEETTLDRYREKIREKRKKKKEVTKSRAKPFEGEKAKGSGISKDDFFTEHISDTEEKEDFEIKKEKVAGGDRPKTTAEELTLLIASNNPDAEPKHFNLKSVVKAEKKKGKKWKRKASGAGGEDNEVQEDFIINVQDERFKILHENHQFAIDPTNPHFKKTKSMAALLEERQKRLRVTQPNEQFTSAVDTTKNKEKNLKSLVESVKRKSVDVHSKGLGKRRKL